MIFLRSLFIVVLGSLVQANTVITLAISLVGLMVYLYLKKHNAA